jgi:hypothetical protein
LFVQEAQHVGGHHLWMDRQYLVVFNAAQAEHTIGITIKSNFRRTLIASRSSCSGSYSKAFCKSSLPRMLGSFFCSFRNERNFRDLEASVIIPTSTTGSLARTGSFSMSAMLLRMRLMVMVPHEKENTRSKSVCYMATVMQSWTKPAITSRQVGYVLQVYSLQEIADTDAPSATRNSLNEIRLL